MDGNLLPVVRSYCFLKGLTVSDGIALFATSFLHDKISDMSMSLDAQKMMIEQSKNHLFKQ